MENFTNEIIDSTQLPKYETIQYSALHSKYWFVVVINLFVLFSIIGIGFGIALAYNKHWLPYGIEIGVGSILFMALAFYFSRVSFLNKGFAFRDHDVLFKSGFIARNTIVIPYNRVQHVAIHEGLVSRYFGLAKIEIFTAGGNSGDIEIPGLDKEQAENIKQLLMGKIQKQL